MSASFEVNAELREGRGTRDSRRLRHSGKVPAVIYGADKDNVALALSHNDISHQLATEAFHSAILKINTGKKSEQAILRDVQVHPYNTKILHVDFQRISATEKIHIKVPLHFVGEDVCPGVKLEDGIITHLITEIDVTCLPSQLPEYIEVDLSEKHLHDSIHISELVVPEGVEVTALAHGGEDQAVAAIAMPKVITEEEEEVVGEEGEEGEADADAEAADPTAAAEGEKSDSE